MLSFVSECWVSILSLDYDWWILVLGAASDLKSPYMTVKIGVCSCNSGNLTVWLLSFETDTLNTPNVLRKCASSWGWRPVIEVICQSECWVLSPETECWILVLRCESELWNLHICKDGYSWGWTHVNLVIYQSASCVLRLDALCWQLSLSSL